MAELQARCLSARRIRLVALPAGTSGGRPQGADPAKLMGLFHSHLYFANWGTPLRLMLRVPLARVDENSCAYCKLPRGRGEFRRITRRITSSSEPGDTGRRRTSRSLPGSLAALSPPLRWAHAGDLRVAYLAWLLAVQSRRGRRRRGAIGAAGLTTTSRERSRPWSTSCVTPIFSLCRRRAEQAVPDERAALMAVGSPDDGLRRRRGCGKRSTIPIWPG
jgi:hypothetical protein